MGKDLEDQHWHQRCNASDQAFIAKASISDILNNHVASCGELQARQLGKNPGHSAHYIPPLGSPG